MRPLRLLRATLAASVLGLLAVATWLRFAPGQLVPEIRFDAAEVYAVKLGAHTFYIDHAFSASDAITAGGLGLIAALLALTAWRLRGQTSAASFATAAAGAAYLAADDALALHETLGHNLGFLAWLPGLDHPDDAVMGFYGLVVAVWMWRNRGLAMGRARWPWVAAAVMGASAVGLDLLPFSVALAEEALEAGCALMLLWGTLATVRCQLAQATGQNPAARAPRLHTA